MNKTYLSEFIGTFFLVFIGTGAIIINKIDSNSLGDLGVSFAFGFIIFIMVYVFGNISGAHFNPAVTIALGFIGKFKRSEILPYIISQIFGAIVGSGLLRLMFGNINSMGSTNPSYNIKNSPVMVSFIVEFVFTFLLMYVIMKVTNNSEKDDSIGAIAIGLTIFIGALVAGPISGGSFNPARSIGPAIVSGNYRGIWIYIIAPIVAAIIAGITYNFNNNVKINTQSLHDKNNEFSYSAIGNINKQTDSI